jgi:hypothetical protein
MGNDVIVAGGPRGRIVTAKIGAPDVYFYFEGRVELEWFEPTMVLVGEAVRRGGARLWGDGEGWMSYAPGYRDAWTRWFLDNRRGIASTCLVVQSPLLRMGVQVVNLFAANPIRVLDTSEELYARMRVEVPKARQFISGLWPKDVAHRFRAAATAARDA